MNALKLAAILILAALPALASAATHTVCVGSAEDLSAALATLSTSTANTDADEIRIRTGHYIAPAAGWVGSVVNHHDLSIRGGYADAACTQRSLDAAQTILDGNHAAGVLTINTPLEPNSAIEVSGLTFQNGSGGNAFESNAGGLKIGDPNPISGGRILVERNIFRNNSAAGNGFSPAIGGLIAATDGESLVVRGNLFVGNESPNSPALYLYSNNEIDVSNNTFTGNHATDASQDKRTTIGYVSLTAFKATNNIFWNNTTGNGAFDIDLTAQFHGFAGATLLDNDIQASTGTPVSEAGTLHADPLFTGAGDFRLAHGSTLIDAGADDPAGGPADVDLAGAARRLGTHIDLGAYESAAATAVPAIGGGFSGNWFDPTANQGGHGLQLEFLPNNGLLVIWFVFNPQGTAQSWIYALGGYDPASNTATVPAYLEQGGAFPPHYDGSKVTPQPWGSLQFTFSDCDHGVVAWKSNAASQAANYRDVNFPIQRLTRIAGTACN